ncbi:hypothetical protein V1954_21905 [Yersinia sp. 2538 StPb PI]|uniref:hypothetical protein n=1 Tax=Yersinia sp. 2538 StPb PI TaxID=3117405 RepID=UPI003FA4BB5B
MGRQHRKKNSILPDDALMRQNPSTPECVNFLNFFDIGAGTSGFFSPDYFRRNTVGLPFSKARSN